MDFRKIDAGLAVALEKAAKKPARLNVFLRTEGLVDQAVAQRMGLRADASGQVMTGSLSHDEIERLSEEPWVARIAIGGRSNMLG